MGKRFDRVKSWFKKKEAAPEQSSLAIAIERRRARRAAMQTGEPQGSTNTFVTRSQPKE